MSKVDQLDDAVDHGVAECDERVHGAVGQTEDGDLHESRWVDDRLGSQEYDRRGADDIEEKVDQAHAAESHRAHSLQG